MLWFIIKWATMQSIAIGGGLALYIFSAVYYPSTLRPVQRVAGWLEDWLLTQSNDAIGVWLDSADLGGKLVLALYIGAALLLINGVSEFTKVCWRAGTGRW